MIDSAYEDVLYLICEQTEGTESEIYPKLQTHRLLKVEPPFHQWRMLMSVYMCAFMFRSYTETGDFGSRTRNLLKGFLSVIVVN